MQEVCDCGFALSESASNWPTCIPLCREVIKAPETSVGPGARGKQAFTLNGGGGTHVDAPAHFVPGGRTIEKLSCGELVGVAVAVIDVSAACALDEDYLCDEAAIAADEAAHGAIERGTLALVRTGWAEARYADAARYLNAPDAADLDEYTQLPRMHFPGLTVGAAERLVRAGVVGVGIDTLSPEGGSSTTFGVHHAILGSDRYIIENLCLTADLAPRGGVAVVSPLKIAGAPEAPARVWVWPRRSECPLLT